MLTLTTKNFVDMVLEGEPGMVRLFLDGMPLGEAPSNESDPQVGALAA